MAEKREVSYFFLCVCVAMVIHLILIYTENVP
jgi:hypothetical protein